MVNVRWETTASCSGATSSLPRDCFWRRAAGVVLALIALPCNGLEIGQITVNSAQGEPLDAVVRVHVDPAESLESGCLSAGTQSDFPQSDHILLTDGVRMRLQPDRKAIRITTTEPVQRPAISIAVRARCRQGPVTVRAFNLQLTPPAIRTLADARSASPAGASMHAGASLAGTTITVKPGDSIYGLSRTIYPHNEQAVRDLALAIVAANPGLFPEGRPRLLEIGEELTIPDLRNVQRIIEQTDTRRTAPVRNDAYRSTTTRPVRHAFAKPLSGHDGRLRLKLAHSLDLSRSRNGDGKSATSLRSQSVDSVDALVSRISRISEAQAQINARIARLETIANTSRELLASRAVERPPLASAPAATPARPESRVPQTTRLAGATGVRSTPWLWAAIATGLVALVFAAFFFHRIWRQRRALAQRKTRIEELLEQARTEATPLLGTEETALPADAATGREIESDHRKSPYLEDDMIERTLDLHPQQAGTDPFLRGPAIEQLPTAPSFPRDHGDSFADSGEIPARLRQEMNDSLDSTRSMFSDIDRFIALGRVQNAISLLEFQIERQPDDRPSWIKLMAVYRHNGMDDDFDRTYANFRERFRNS